MASVHNSFRTDVGQARGGHKAAVVREANLQHGIRDIRCSAKLAAAERHSQSSTPHQRCTEPCNIATRRHGNQCSTAQSSTAMQRRAMQHSNTVMAWQPMQRSIAQQSTAQRTSSAAFSSSITPISCRNKKLPINDVCKACMSSSPGCGSSACAGSLRHQLQSWLRHSRNRAAAAAATALRSARRSLPSQLAAPADRLASRMWMAGVHTASPQILSRGKCSCSGAGGRRSGCSMSLELLVAVSLACLGAVARWAAARVDPQSS